MKKQIILLSLFFMASLFLNSVQALDLDNLEICPNPNSSETPPVLEVGYTCKVPTVNTRPGSDEGYRRDGYVQWTLMKKEGDRKIWAAHTGRWGLVYVGSIEDGYYTLGEAEEVCNRIEEIAFNGEVRHIKMTLPEIGFGRGYSDIENPLNFELLTYLNHKSVVPNGDGNWYWSNSPPHGFRNIFGFVFHPASGDLSKIFIGYKHLVRCMGRVDW